MHSSRRLARMKSYLLIGTCLILGGAGTYFGRSLLNSAPAEGPAAVARDPASYRDIVKKVLPAVVSLEAQAKGGRTRRRRDEDMEQDDRSQVGFGSGFLISPKGVMVTSRRVVEGA